MTATTRCVLYRHKRCLCVLVSNAEITDRAAVFDELGMRTEWDRRLRTVWATRDCSVSQSQQDFLTLWSTDVTSSYCWYRRQRCSRIHTCICWQEVHSSPWKHREMVTNQLTDLDNTHTHSVPPDNSLICFQLFPIYFSCSCSTSAVCQLPSCSTYFYFIN